MGYSFNSSLSFLNDGMVYLFGDSTILLKVLICFIAADYITAGLASLYQHRLNREIGFKSITKKLAIFILISIAHQADLIINHQNTIRDAVIFFYLANELISIFGNITAMEIDIPKSLRKLVQIFRTEAGEKKKKRNQDDDQDEL